MSTLFIVATPIGNLGDISERALDTFRNVDVIAAEDTRHTLRLLNRFGIKKHLISCRARNEEEGARQVISVLDKGQNVAYASDAGTPALCDPGAVLVRMARDSGHIISPIPGPSAFAALLSVAGGYDKSVVFEGFLPQRPGKRRTRIAELMGSGSGVVFYESPYRIVKLLGDVADIDCDRYVVVGREMTKIHEEFLTGRVSDILQELNNRSKILGEFAVYVSGNKKLKVLSEDDDI